jgi:hypothetical protein
MSEKIIQEIILPEDSESLVDPELYRISLKIENQLKKPSLFKPKFLSTNGFLSK